MNGIVHKRKIRTRWYNDVRSGLKHADPAPPAFWADLLDPPASAALRRRVADAIHAIAVTVQGCACEEGLHGAEADAVLAVVADWLAAQPVTLARATKDDPSPSPEHVQREHDLRLLRGES